MISKVKKANKWLSDYIILIEYLFILLPVEDKKIASNLLKNFSDIKKILKSDNKDKIKFIYYNESKISEILMDNDEIILISDENIYYFKEFDNCFYLGLLVLKDPNIMNYNFSKNLISNIFKFSKLVIKRGILITLWQKIVLDLINNYKLSDLYDSTNDDNELKKIVAQCEGTISKYISLFKNIDVDIKENDFYSLKIDETYTKILNALIKSDKFNNADYLFEIVNELELENIYITKTMFDELSKTLSMDNDYIKPYLIMKVEDLFDIKRINFYFFLIKYIFKNPFYFFHIPLLLNVRNIIIYIIRKELNKMFYFKSKYEKAVNIIDRVDYLIKVITDNEYYYKKYIEHFRLCKLQAIVFFSKNFFCDCHKTAIKVMESVVVKKESEKYEKILKENNKLIEDIEIRLNMINIMYKLNLFLGDYILNQKKLEKYTHNWCIMEKMIKTGKFKRLQKDTCRKLINLSFNKDNLEIIYKIFDKGEYLIFLGEMEKNKNLPKINIIDNSNDSKIIAKAMDSADFRYDNQLENSSIMIQTYSVYSNSKATSISNQSQYMKNFSTIFEKEENMVISLKDQEYFKKPDIYKIIEHCKIIGRHDSAEFIRQLSNGELISGGKDNEIKRYDQSFSKIEEIDLKEPQYNLYEINPDNNREEEEINIISFSKNKINFLSIKSKEKKSEIEGKLKNPSLISVYYLDKNSSLILGLEKIATFSNYWHKTTTEIKSIYNLDTYYRGGISITIQKEQIFAFTSSEIIPNGENKMIFYNYYQNRIIGEINGYSFVTSYNNLCEINQKLIPNQKVLLGACSKKEKGVIKFGILVINLQYYKTFKYSYYFEETKNFEVSCFCQILNVDNNNSIYDDITNKKMIDIKYTEYVFICGYENNKREGLIKLYSITIDKDKENFIKIKFIQDIEIEKNKKFKGFDGKISCIIQSKITGNILVTCWDGNVHLFKPPNIDFFTK